MIELERAHTNDVTGGYDFATYGITAGGIIGILLGNSRLTSRERSYVFFGAGIVMLGCGVAGICESICGDN